MKSSSENNVENAIRSILSRFLHGLEFEELRDELEDMGIYLDGLRLRRVVAKMIREGVLCKEVSKHRKKLLLRLCGR